jgi:hypothetical protein
MTLVKLRAASIWDKRESEGNEERARGGLEFIHRPKGMRLTKMR